MFGFDLTKVSYADLTEEQRTKLLNLISAEEDYLQAALKLNNLRMQALVNPGQKTQEAVEDFASAVVASKRDKLTEERRALMMEAVDIDGAIGLLYSAGLGVLQHVNLPLLMEAAGVDPDVAQKAMTDVATFLKKGAAK